MVSTSRCGRDDPCSIHGDDKIFFVLFVVWHRVLQRWRVAGALYFGAAGRLADAVIGLLLTVLLTPLLLQKPTTPKHHLLGADRPACSGAAAKSALRFPCSVVVLSMHHWRYCYGRRACGAIPLSSAAGHQL